MTGGTGSHGGTRARRVEHATGSAGPASATVIRVRLTRAQTVPATRESQRLRAGPEGRGLARASPRRRAGPGTRRSVGRRGAGHGPGGRQQPESSESARTTGPGTGDSDAARLSQYSGIIAANTQADWRPA